MKLFNKKIDFLVVEFVDHEPIFHDRFLEAEMEEHGIAIPAKLKSEYNGKSRVFIDDEDFEKAFKEVYVPFAMHHSDFEWRS